MKFLAKNPNSQILIKGLTYKKGQTDNNKRLNDLLLQEQKNFCAYSEKYVGTITIVKNGKTIVQNAVAMEVEHFNPELKYNDGYHNYYSVDRNINVNKKTKCPEFALPLFFQSLGGFESRIELFIDEELRLCIYDTKDPNDVEAQNLINYLNLKQRDIMQTTI